MGKAVQFNQPSFILRKPNTFIFTLPKTLVLSN